MCYFWRFFEIFSKTLLTISMKLGQNVEGILPEHLQKTACPNKFFFSRYSSLKVRFGPKIAKMGSKESPISRERKMLSKIWFDIRNLRKIIFLVRLIRFLPTCRLQGENLPWNRPIFDWFSVVFEWFLGIFSPTTWKILMKLGQRRDKMDTKLTQKTRG